MEIATPEWPMILCSPTSFSVWQTHASRRRRQRGLSTSRNRVQGKAALLSTEPLPHHCWRRHDLVAEQRHGEDVARLGGVLDQPAHELNGSGVESSLQESRSQRVRRNRQHEQQGVRLERLLDSSGQQTDGG